MDSTFPHHENILFSLLNHNHHSSKPLQFIPVPKKTQISLTPNLMTNEQRVINNTWLSNFASSKYKVLDNSNDTVVLF